MRTLHTAAFTVLMTGTLLAQPDPSAAVGAWTVNIASSGGFAGRKAAVTVTSDGNATCDPAPCTQALDSNRLKQIESAVRAAAADTWTLKASRFGTCYDCARTTMTLKRREADGVRTYTANWSALDGVAPAIQDLARLVSAFGSRPVR